MNEPTSAPLPPRPPLGLPPGSIRATLTLLIVAVVVVQTLHGQKLAPLWAETLMIALAHYFTSRRFIDLPPETIKRLEAEGLVPQEAQPLYLPRHSIRVLLFLTFAGLGGYLYYIDKLFTSEALTLLGVVASYILGMVLRSIRTWITRGKQSPGMRIWEDLKAAVVLLAIGATAVVQLIGHPEWIPEDLQNITLGLVLFYFGSR